MGWEATDERVTPAESGWQPEIVASNPIAEQAQRTVQTTDDLVRAAANAVSAGMADRLAGAMPGTSTAEQVKLSEKARKRSPYASIAGDVAGSAMIPGLGGGALATRLGSGAVARGLGYGAEGAIIGGAQGAGNVYTGKLQDYLEAGGKGAAMGGILGTGAGAALAPRALVSGAKVPTLDELGRGTDIAYDALRANQARYDPAQFTSAANKLEQDLLTKGYIPDPGYSTASFRAAERMRDLPANAAMPTPNAVTPYNIDLIRQGINKIPRSADADRAAGRIVKEALDEFIVNPPPGAVLPGSAAEATRAAQQASVARKMRAGEGRAEMFNDILENALTSAGAQHSGLNVQNKLRQGVSAGLRQKEGSSAFSRAGYSDEEIAKLTEFARVPRSDATLRYIDRLAGGGGGLGAVVAGGVGGGAAGQYFKDDPQMGTAVGVGIPAIGLALRGIGNRRAAGTMNELGEMIRRRNPLYEARAAAAPMVPGSSPLSGPTTKWFRDAIALEMIKQQEK